jgi:hypothetical protein
MVYAAPTTLEPPPAAADAANTNRAVEKTRKIRRFMGRCLLAFEDPTGV